MLTHASDCWAYAVVLWELFSLGADPWPDQTREQVCVLQCFVFFHTATCPPGFCSSISFESTTYFHIIFSLTDYNCIACFFYSAIDFAIFLLHFILCFSLIVFFESLHSLHSDIKKELNYISRKKTQSCDIRS